MKECNIELALDVADNFVKLHRGIKKSVTFGFD